MDAEDRYFDLARQSADQHWSALRALQYYRLLMLSLLLMLVLFDTSQQLLAIPQHDRFVTALVTYLGLILLALPFNIWQHPALFWQALSLALVDIVGLSLLAATTAGLGSDLLLLLIIAVAGAGVLLPLGWVLALAGITGLALTVLWLATDPVALEQLMSVAHLPPVLLIALFDEFNGPLTRILGLTLSAGLAGVAVYRLAERSRINERRARKQAIAAFDLDQLNRAIVRQIKFGILVVDRRERLRLMNETAGAMLGCPGAAVVGVKLDTISPALARRLSQWRSSGEQPDEQPQPFRCAKHLPELLARFNGLGLDATHSSTLVTLEDYREVEQQLHRIKLAGLGRMSASIAHELRNPMNAISHAAQLLQESPGLGESERRMAGIIHNNIRRADRIINEVMSLARRRPPRSETILLHQWLRGWREGFMQTRNDDRLRITLLVTPGDLAICFDPDHLYQVIDNMAGNACRYGTNENGEVHIRIEANHAGEGRIRLDFSDTGPGIAEIEQHKLFEPFHTTSTQGTGLGLYLARELCEANRARMRYLPTPQGGHFRIEAVAARRALPNVSNW